MDKLRIYGGFDGTETALEERDWNEHQTVIDGGRKISPLRNSALESEVNTVLDGLIIQNGVNHDNANGNGNGGGAILTNGARVSKCIFRNNRTKNGKNGGALHCHVGKIHVDNSLFINNTSSGNGGLYRQEAEQRQSLSTARSRTIRRLLTAVRWGQATAHLTSTCITVLHGTTWDMAHMKVTGKMLILTEAEA